MTDVYVILAACLHLFKEIRQRKKLGTHPSCHLLSKLPLLNTRHWTGRFSSCLPVGDTESYPRRGCGVCPCNNVDAARWVCDSKWSLASFSLLLSAAHTLLMSWRHHALCLPTLGPCSNLPSISVWFGRGAGCRNRQLVLTPRSLSVCTLSRPSWQSQRKWPGIRDDPEGGGTVGRMRQGKGRSSPQ